jgi:threonine aldolase
MCRWRQAGLLAAMGLVALDDYPRRMATDHLHARQLGEICLQRGFGLALPVETNMVFLDTRPLDIDANQLANMLAKYDILVMPMDANTIRMVLHHQVQRTDLDRFIDVLDELLHTRPWSNQETPTHSTGVYKL